MDRLAHLEPCTVAKPPGLRGARPARWRPLVCAVPMLAALLFSGPALARELPPSAGPLLRAAWNLGWEPEQRHRAVVCGPGHAQPVSGSLAELMAWAEVLQEGRVELAWPFSLQLDVAIEAMGMAPLVAERRRTLGVSGKGVIIGIIDSGIDWTHPDFADDEGLPRITWLLDFNGAVRPETHPGIDPHGGALWSRAELLAAIAGEPVDGPPPGDELGHGTHVASIAAGRPGEALGADGVAPDAELIIVKATAPGSLSLADADILAGVRFILERARATGQPAVINLSLGGHSGPHDGSSAFERALQELVEDQPGVVLVTAAGNDSGRAVHASGPLSAKEPLALRVPTYERTWDAPSFALVDLWYERDPQQDPPSFVLRTPDGRTIGPVSPGQDSQDLSARFGPISINHAASDPQNPARGQVVVFIQEPIGSVLQGGLYTIEAVDADGSSRFDAWIAQPGFFGARMANHLDQDSTLTVPGTVSGAITVGAHVTRNQWVDASMNVWSTDRIPGTVASFSGAGPTTDGRPKPDLIAPGSVLAAAMASQSDPDNPGAASIFALARAVGYEPVVAGGKHAVFEGTSMASAFVSGAAALLLEQNPSRTHREVADLLRSTAQHGDPSSLGHWDPRAGFGLLSVLDALRPHNAQSPPGPIDPAMSSVGVSRDVISPLQSFEVLVVARDAQGRPLEPGWSPSVEILTPQGAADVGLPHQNSARVMAVPVEAGTAQGQATVLVSVDGQRLDAQPQVTFAQDRRDLEPPVGTVAGGACAQVPRDSPWPPMGSFLILGCVALGWALRRRNAPRATGFCPISYKG